MPHTKKTNLTGTVIDFNVSPHGYYESLLLDVNADTVQVNFSPEEATHIAGSLKVGSKADVSVEEERGRKPSAHEVYNLISIEPSSSLPGEDRHPRKPVKVKGQIVRLNYAKHGEVNGAILDNGCFIHLKPEGAKEADLKVGQQLEMEGEEKCAPAYRVVDVEEFGKKIRLKK